jgi:hypothetical protein
LSTNAASLYIDPAFSELYRGDAITMQVRLDVDEEQGECVNAIDGVLNYSDSLDPIDVSTGGSIISLWPESPIIDKENNQITFAGGIPNGYCGRVAGDPRLTNTLLKIVFRLPGFSIGGSNFSAGTGTVRFSEQSTVYLNDGFGTRIAPNIYPATITLNDSAGTNLKNDWRSEVNADIIPPQEFSITLDKNEQAFSQKYFVVFNTTDKQTGIDQYQIMEQPLSQFSAFDWGRADAPWVPAVSPYVLEDQSLNSIIRVKAIDKAGNEYIATLVPDESLRTMSQTELLLYVALGVGIFFLMSIVFVVWLLLRKRKQRKQVAVEEIASKLDEDDDITEDLTSDKT